VPDEYQGGENQEDVNDTPDHGPEERESDYPDYE
jgi:hypothetical protein